jgi:hypothetical protein
MELKRKISSVYDWAKGLAHVPWTQSPSDPAFRFTWNNIVKLETRLAGRDAYLLYKMIYDWHECTRRQWDSSTTSLRQLVTYEEEQIKTIQLGSDEITAWSRYCNKSASYLIILDSDTMRILVLIKANALLAYSQGSAEYLVRNAIECSLDSVALEAIYAPWRCTSCNNVTPNDCYLLECRHCNMARHWECGSCNLAQPKYATRVCLNCNADKNSAPLQKL